MAFGLQIFDAAGNPRLDTSDKITRLIYSKIIPKDESSSITITGFDSTKGIAITTCMDPNTTKPRKMAHQVKSVGSTITWIPAMKDDTGARPTGSNSLLLVFMYG